MLKAVLNLNLTPSGAIRAGLKRFGRYTKARTKALLACAAFFGMSISAQAQQFDTAQFNPWGLMPETSASLLSPAVGDLDGDGDMDVLSVSFVYSGYSYTNTVRYHANIGNDSVPSFDTAQVDPFSIAGRSGFAIHPVLVDLDNDGDLDLFTSGYAATYYGYTLSNTFEYLENTGTATAPTFGTPQTNPFGLADITSGIAFARFVDIDNDGDKDLFAAADSSVYYYANTGTASAPSFGSVQTNPFGIGNNAFGSSNGVTINFYDFDGDGDMDILAGAPVYDTTITNEIFTYFHVENTGTASAPAFGTPQVSPFGLSTYATAHNPVLADFDNDGDMDIFGGEYDGNTYMADFFYIEDTTAQVVIAVPQVLNEYNIQAMPNPTSGQVELLIEAPADRTQKLQLAVVNLLGAVVETRQLSLNGGQNRVSLDLSNLPAGQYQVRLTDGKRSNTQRIIKH